MTIQVAILPHVKQRSEDYINSSILCLRRMRECELCVCVCACACVCVREREREKGFECVNCQTLL